MNSNKNFQNFKIQHDKKQINEGVDYVFTLQDKNVLENSDEELDVLENQILRDTNKHTKKKENIFDTETKKNILSKYDEVKEDGFTLKIGDKEKLTDDQEDCLEVEESTGELSRIKEKFRLLKHQKPEVKNYLINYKKISNHKKEIQLIYEKKFTTDYMTHEEFKGVKTDFKKKKIPLKKGIHSIQTEEDQHNDLSDTVKIHATNKPGTQVYDEYDELNLFLEKQRNLTNKSKKIEPELVISQALKSEEERNTINKDNLEDLHTDQEDKKKNMTEFISETTEFLKKIPSKSEIEENYKLITAPTPFSLKDSKSGSQSVVNIPLPNERLKFGASSIINPNEKFLNRKRENTNRLVTEEEETKSQISVSENVEKEEKNEELEEPLVGKGIATALKVLRRRGVIGKTELWGRMKDSAHTSNEVFLPKNELDKFNNNNIDIEYRDTKGRLLTPKEMFRQQCYIFHGSGPGRKKQEKRLLREQMLDKMKNQDPSESKTFKYLKTYQKKTNSPYLVLQGKNTSLP